MLQFNDSGTPQSPRQSIQCAPAVLLVRPARFGYNPETAASNRFQRDERPGDAGRALAAGEFERLHGALQAAGVRCCVAEDTPEPIKPDAVFPNNWVSFHRDGSVVLYPMHAMNRRAERRLEILDAVERQLGFRRRRVLDLSAEELQGRFLEGTGSLVLDHVERVAYACRSPRTDASLVRAWAHEMNYEAEVFDALDASGTPIYHTNVMLAIGARWAVLCTDSVAVGERGRLLARLRASQREVVEIGVEAMRSFAANILELRAGSATVLVMSRTARAALGGRPWAQLRAASDQVLEIDVPTIERLGGGGVRCMLAEVPERSP